MRFFLIVFLISFEHTSGQKLPVKDKLAIVSFLSNGKVADCYTRNPTPERRGMCLFEFDCKDGFFTPASDTIQAVSNHFMVAMQTYVLYDSLEDYDTAAVQFLFFENGVRKRKGWGFRTNLQPSTQLSVDDRLHIILNILPFSGGVATRNAYSVEFILHQIPGYSPYDDLTRFSTMLGFVVNDFVYMRKNKQTIVDFIDDSRKSRLRIVVTKSSIKSFISSICNQPEP
jgi:hypothetical protein